jgi:hypothetical protein
MSRWRLADADALELDRSDLMYRLLVTPVLAFGMVATAVTSLQAQSEVIRAWNVSWVSASDWAGNRSTLPVLGWAGDSAPKAGIKYSAPPEISVVASLDEKLRMARLSNNTEALAGLLSEDFVETDQNASSRNKVELIERVRTFRINSLETIRATIRSSGQAVTIVGEQTEVNPSGTDRMVFTRLYVQAPSKEWRLLASTQFRKP